MARTQKRPLAKSQKVKISIQTQTHAQSTHSGAGAVTATASQWRGYKSFEDWCREATMEISQTRSLWLRHERDLSNLSRAVGALSRAP